MTVFISPDGHLLNDLFDAQYILCSRLPSVVLKLPKFEATALSNNQNQLLLVSQVEPSVLICFLLDQLRGQHGLIGAMQ